MEGVGLDDGVADVREGERWVHGKVSSCEGSGWWMEGNTAE